MAEIENVPWTSGHRSQNAPGLGGDGFRIGRQQERIKIALDRHLVG